MSSFELLANHVAAGRADRQMHVAAGGAQHLQQPHGVDRAAGAGDAENDGMIHVDKLGSHVSCQRD